MMRRIGVDDAVVLRVHIIVAEIPDLVLLDELKLKCIVGDFFHFFVTIKGNDHANYH